LVWSICWAYVQSTLGGLTPEQAHARARATADTGRLIPGTDAFKNALIKLLMIQVFYYGSKLVDNLKNYHSDANFSF
jgi:hypothetical protein